MYKKLVEILRKKQISVYKLCKDTGVNRSTLTAWKNGTYTPKRDKLEKIAVYLGVNVSDFTERESGIVFIDTELNHGKEVVLSHLSAERTFGADFAITCEDSSLLGERIAQGDTVFCKRQSTVDTEGLYVLALDDTLLIRRIYFSDRKTLVLGVCGSAPTIYQDRECASFQILGKVLGFYATL